MYIYVDNQTFLFPARNQGFDSQWDGQHQPFGLYHAGERVKLDRQTYKHSDAVDTNVNRQTDRQTDRHTGR